MISENGSVVVIGAGIIGCNCAYQLAKAGLRTQVVESRQLCREASWASAGMIHEEITPSESLNLFRRKSVSMFPSLAQEISDLTGVDSTYRMNGGFHLFEDAGRSDEMEKFYRAHRNYDIPCERTDAAEVIRREPALSPHIAGGIYFPQNGQIDPRRYTQVMAQAAMQLGAAFHFGRPVTGFLREKGRVIGVKTPLGDLRADYVVLAAGAWSGLVGRELGMPLVVQPVRGQMIRLETKPPRLNHTVHCGSLYLVARKDGSILVGSTVEHAGYDKRVTPAGIHSLLEMVRRLAPGLQDATLADCWCGLRPHPGRDVPVIGPGPEGLFIATGHYRSGVIDSPLTGKLVAEWISSGRTSLSIEPYALSANEAAERP
jgi:glycine oxidase